MTETTKAVVVHVFPYSETSLIAKTYTRKFGFSTYIFKGIKKRRKDKALLFPLSLVEISALHKSDGELNFGRTIHGYQSHPNLHSNPVKSTIAMFLAEWLLKTLAVGEADEDLFDWIEKSLELLEQTKTPANYHLWFLIRLTHYMGFIPANNFSAGQSVFNLDEREFTSGSVPGDKLQPNESRLLKHLLEDSYNDIMILRVNAFERRNLLYFFHHYFQKCLNLEFELKSMEVLIQIFRS